MKNINSARKLIMDRVIEPALESNVLTDEIKYKIKNTKIWLNHFLRIGDLYFYLNRFNRDNPTEMYRALKKIGLITFEDIVDEFNILYDFAKDDITNNTSFVVGNMYSSYDILIYAKKYDTRSGGMFILGNNDAVIIKATLEGGDYKNKWTKKDIELKYYMKSIKGKFSETYIENKTIINNIGIPIYTFVRNTKKDSFVYKGVFKYINHESDNTSKWFNLRREASPVGVEYYNYNAIVDKLERDVKASLNDSSGEERVERLRVANKKPKKMLSILTVYSRNPDVIVEVLKRANGRCEICTMKAPFIRKKDGTPYLEVHHKIRLADDGDDSIENAIAICPNCHRNEHFGV